MSKTFTVEYQAPGSATGLTVTGTCYDEAHAEVVGQSGVFTEVGITGKYYKSFVVDNPDWTVHISDSAGGKAIKHFKKSEWDAHGIDAKVEAVDSQLVVTDANILALDSQITVMEGKVDNLTSPPMLG